MQREELLAWLTLNASGLSVDRQLRLLEVFGRPEAVLAAPDEDLKAVPGIEAIHVRKLREAQAGPALDDAEKKLADLGATVVGITHADYPAALKEIPLPPPMLFVQGELRAQEPAVAIVGTRKCTPYGRQMARRLGYDIAARGLTIVSGMALGIDAEAHEGALEAGGRTLAVLGCGLDITYPPQHKSLRERIAAQGAVLTELPFGAEPTRDQFPRRNRIISGLAMGVIVVEAPDGSGALITATYAGEHGREVMAVPGDVTRAESAGCNSLIRDGATLVRCAEDVLEALNFTPETLPARPAGPSAEGLPPDEAAVYENLAGETKTVDDLVVATGLEAPRIMAALMMLEVKGLVRRFGGGTYARTER
ncbi:MAG: DNA-processing protein DprA [Armatimonadetes bacterium]|nr:DNA-processing protein DprA [Armatimonadota bacterium]